MQAAGFSVGPIVTGGVAEFSAFGVEGVIAPLPDPANGRGYCSVRSGIVPLATAEDAIYAGAQQAYPTADFTEPGRFYRAACHHMQITLHGIRHELSIDGIFERGSCGTVKQWRFRFDPARAPWGSDGRDGHAGRTGIGAEL